MRSPLAGVLLLIFVLISWLIAIALVAGWIGSIVWMAIAEGAGAAIVAFLVGGFVLLLLAPLAAGIAGVVASSIDRLDFDQRTSPAVEAPADDEVGESEEDASNGLEVWAYTKFGRKGHILIDGTDNLALCGRECERRTGEDYFEACDTCWSRQEGNRRYWARRLRKSIDEKHSGTVITLFGANGGIGKTIMATNLAVALAQSGQRVALVDLHLRFGDVALLMEVPNEPNIADLVGAERKVTEESLERCLYRHETGVSVLPCPFPLAEWQRVRAHVGCIETVVTLLAQTYDYVVLDTGLPFDHVMALALKLASTVLFVTTLDQTSLDDSHRVLGMLRLWHFPQDRIKLIANATNERPIIEPHDIAQALGREVFASVPYDRHISMATEPGTPLVVSHPESRAAQSILGLGRRVALGRRRGRRMMPTIKCVGCDAPISPRPPSPARPARSSRPRRRRAPGIGRKIMEQPVNELGVALNSIRMDLFRNTMSNWAKTKYPASDAEHKRLGRFINALTGAPEDKAELPDGFDYGEWDMDKAVEAAGIALERPDLLGEAVIKNNDYNKFVDFLLRGGQ